MPVHARWDGRGPPALPVARVRAEATRMLKALSLGRAELSVLLTDDAKIRALNLAHRRKDAPTDVLAFAMREGAHARKADPLLGDVVISLPTAKRQARAHGLTLAEEARMLLAHGLLHLLGFDHRNRAEERRMKALTDVLVTAARRL